MVLSQQYLVTFKICVVVILLLGAFLSTCSYEHRRLSDATHPLELFTYIIGMALCVFVFIIPAIWSIWGIIRELELEISECKRELELKISEYKRELEYLKSQQISLSN